MYAQTLGMQLTPGHGADHSASSSIASVLHTAEDKLQRHLDGGMHVFSLVDHFILYSQLRGKDQ
jgi:hypothetical protein